MAIIVTQLQRTEEILDIVLFLTKHEERGTKNNTCDFLTLKNLRVKSPSTMQSEVQLMKKKLSPPTYTTGANTLDRAISRALKLQTSYQHKDGYWWYTLEANEAIGAEYIQMMHFLGVVDKPLQERLANRILSKQNSDGSWSLYYGDQGDLNITIECYFVLKLAGHDINSEHMRAARKYILDNGGITKCRVFTRIHLAQFGLLSWSTCPAMPIELILLPDWMPVNIYEFSSWARACIIPLLVLMNKKPVRKLKGNFDLEELYLEPPKKRDFQFSRSKSFISWENFFIQFDRWLKLFQHVPFKPIKNQAIRACEKWISEHIAKTEDIYPAMAYAAMAMHTLGHPIEHPVIQKCLSGLRRFQHDYVEDLSPVPFKKIDPARTKTSVCTHQQCCISPVWDTPWSVTAMLDAGLPANDPRLLKAGRWLMSKQILDDFGDWKIKNPHGRPGGWSFEFENVYFPDVDDTVQVLHVLNQLALPLSEKQAAMDRGIAWILSMQNDDGGWAAFDKNNNLDLVNRIPFSDHGACLDPSSPDITARVIALLSQFGYSKDEGVLRKALNYIYTSQSSFGGWYGRWGINYIYGTWCVLTALKSIGENMHQLPCVKTAVKWLRSIQRADGGWGESPESYIERKYISTLESVPSQTAWALMGLMAATGTNSSHVKKGIEFLLERLSAEGNWDENYFTGTGFPGHFYIRYHGYRHYFPLMTLGQYRSKLLNT